MNCSLHPIAVKIFIKILFVDFSKAFDPIDHNILLNKFVSNDLPEHVTVWSLDFLNDRKQFVKIGESVSTTTVIGAGTPQGTVSGPDDFTLVTGICHLMLLMPSTLMTLNCSRFQTIC